MMYAICATEEFINSHLYEIAKVNALLLDKGNAHDVRVLEVLWPQLIDPEFVFNHCVTVDDISNQPTMLDGAVIIFEEKKDDIIFTVKVIEGMQGKVKLLVDDIKNIFRKDSS